MTEQGLVTVIVPNFNHADFLKERIESILNQTYPKLEIILLDDASTDRSVEILREFANDDRVRLIVNESNTGSPFAQWNRGIKEAKGDYVWIAESDDSALPEFLEKMVAALNTHTTAVLAQCASSKIDANGEDLGPMMNDAFPEEARWTKPFLVSGRQEIQQYLYLQNTIPSASAVLFKRSIYRQAGLADPSYRLSGDWWQWCRILRFGDLCFLPETLSFSRIHAQSQRSTGATDGRLEWETLKVQENLRALFEIDPAMVRKAAERVALSWLQGVRSGRYRGPLFRHFSILRKLFQANTLVGLSSAARLPYCLTAWIAKNTIFRHSHLSTEKRRSPGRDQPEEPKSG